jgi:hypothetical protein
LDIEEAKGLIRTTRINGILDGFRGLEPVDRDEVARAIVELGDLLIIEERVEEIEVNPFIGSHEKVIAVDCRVKMF